MKAILATIILCMPIVVFAQLTDELRDCSAITDSAARLECYDNLGERAGTVEAPPEKDVSPKKDVPPEKKEVVSEDAGVQRLSDETGRETLERADREADEEVAMRGTVTSCSKDSVGKYYYHFQNGQVWKRVSSGRINVRDCNFEVTIMRDNFGYKMQRDGEKRRHRISRVR